MKRKTCVGSVSHLRVERQSKSVKDDVRRAVVASILSLSPSALRVYLAICSHARRSKSGEERCWPSVGRLALLTNLSRRTVSRAITELVRDGWLTTVPMTGRRSMFALATDRPSARCWFAKWIARSCESSSQ